MNLLVQGSGAANQAQAAVDAQSATQATKVVIGGQQIQKMPSLSQLVQDLQEEISFAHQERLESEDNFDEGIDDRSSRIRERMIARIKETYEGQEAGNETAQNRERMITNLRSGQFQNLEQLLENLGGFTSDHGEMFAMLVAAADELPADSAAGKLVDEAIVATASMWEHQVTAAVNTVSESDKVAVETGIKRDELQRLYQDSVVTYESVINTLSELVAKFGLDRVETGTEFLQEAARADLVSLPSSVDPERLEHTLLELQGMKVYNTLRENIDMAHERASTKDAHLAKLDRSWLTTSFIRALNDPSEFDAHIKLRVEGGGSSIQNRVLLLQDLKNAISETPSHYFQDGGKDRAESPWQTEIDNLIYEEAEE